MIDGNLALKVDEPDGCEWRACQWPDGCIRPAWGVVAKRDGGALWLCRQHRALVLDRWGVAEPIGVRAR